MREDVASFVLWVGIGLATGAVAAAVVYGPGTLLRSAVAGLVGAIVGGVLARQLDFRPRIAPALAEQLVISFIGALFILSLVWVIVS